MRAVPFFEADEVRSTIPLGVLASLLAGQPYGPTPAELWTVRDGDAEVLFALRTAPYPFSLALGQPAHAAILGRARADAELAGELDALTQVNGPRALAGAFAEAFAARGGRAARVKERLCLYDLERVTPPPLPEGGFRAACALDVPQLVAFEEAFLVEVDVPAFDVAAGVAREVASERVFVWETQGRLVSMAKWGAETRTTARVRLVYTPREERGKGYAGACVAALSQRLLDAGRARLCLNADLDNPTSTALYLRLGYRAVENIDTWELGAPAARG